MSVVGLEGYTKGGWGRLDATSNVYGGLVEALYTRYEVDSTTENEEKTKYSHHV